MDGMGVGEQDLWDLWDGQDEKHGKMDRMKNMVSRGCQSSKRALYWRGVWR